MSEINNELIPVLKLCFGFNCNFSAARPESAREWKSWGITDSSRGSAQLRGRKRSSREKAGSNERSIALWTNPMVRSKKKTKNKKIERVTLQTVDCRVHFKLREGNKDNDNNNGDNDNKVTEKGISRHETSLIALTKESRVTNYFTRKTFLNLHKCGTSRALVYLWY